MRKLGVGKMLGMAALGLGVATLLGSGIVYAATTGGNRGSAASGDQSGSMMAVMGGQPGSRMGNGPMGSFDPSKPFDLQFIDQMTVHHEGAVLSSQAMVADSNRPELRRLAQDIIASQSEQIREMRSWRPAWYGTIPTTFGMTDPVQMDQMMTGGAMQSMVGGSMRRVMGGDLTDVMFLQMMIAHHRLAIRMSREALTQATHPALRQLAQTIIKEQSAQIARMQQYLATISASAPASSMMGPGMVSP